MKEGGGRTRRGKFFFPGGSEPKKQPGNSTYPVKYDRVIHQPPSQKKTLLYFQKMLQGRAATFGGSLKPGGV